MLGQQWVNADVKNTKLERCICRKHNGRATKSLQKVFFGIFLRKSEPRSYFFSLCKTAHFLIKLCLFSARENFWPQGYGAKFSAAGHQQLFKHSVGTPYGSAGLGKKLRAKNLQAEGPQIFVASPSPTTEHERTNEKTDENGKIRLS